MGWTAPRTWVAGEVPSASVMNTHVRDNLTALVWAEAIVATEETTTSTSYTDLATTGPEVTLDTGTAARVFVACAMFNSGVAATWMSSAVSGDTTVAAADSRAAAFNSDTAGNGGFRKSGRLSRYVALTAGSNTFTAKYRVGGGTGTYSDRRILVLGV